MRLMLIVMGMEVDLFIIGCRIIDYNETAVDSSNSRVGHVKVIPLDNVIAKALGVRPRLLTMEG